MSTTHSTTSSRSPQAALPRKAAHAARGAPGKTGAAGQRSRSRVAKSSSPEQVVLVLQGGGALGAYQVGVYQALHEAGIEPDWVIGTSIGAINAALICGNRPAHRLDRLHGFWDQVEQKGFGPIPLDPFGIAAALGTMSTVLRGIPSFFTP